MAQQMLEAALRAAPLRDTDGNPLRTVGDLVATIVAVAPVEQVPLPRGGELEPAAGAAPAGLPAPELSAELPLADAVGRLLSGPHANGDRIAVVGQGGRGVYSAWDVFARLAGALAHSTLFDGLTGLPTRRAVLDEVDRRLETASPESPVGLLQVELGQLKDINDSLGYELGDEMIVRAAEELRSALAPEDVLGRLVGDEFAVLLALPAQDPADAALAVARRLLDVLAGGVALNGQHVPLQSSVGVCVVDAPAANAEHVLRRADAAMSRAKRFGRGRAEMYDPLTDRPVDKLSKTRRLREAIDAGSLYLHWQPIHRIADGLLVGAEALVRWEDEATGRLVPPDEFIPYAETVGLIVPIGAQVLDLAARQSAVWESKGVPLSVSVNLSPQQVVTTDLVSDVRAVLRRRGVAPSALRLELTETAAVEDYLVTQRRLAELRDLGVRLSLDDFGTGFSSLRLLRELKVDDVKIDKSFVQGVDTDRADVAMVRLVVETAHALGLTVTAEGVERSGQLEVLAELGCDRVQGFLLGMPVPVVDFEVEGSEAAARELRAPGVRRAVGA